MSDTPIYDQLRREAEIAEADAHTLRRIYGVMSA